MTNKFQKVYEAKGEDVVPCVLCNRCHGGGQNGPWIAKCTVNPKLGDKVVFVGGGEWGVQTAVYLAKAGHKVTILSAEAYSGFGGEKQLFQTSGPHQGSSLIFVYSHMDNFNAITGAIVTRI